MFIEIEKVYVSSRRRRCRAINSTSITLSNEFPLNKTHYFVNDQNVLIRKLFHEAWNKFRTVEAARGQLGYHVQTIRTLLEPKTRSKAFKTLKRFRKFTKFIKVHKNMKLRKILRKVCIKVKEFEIILFAIKLSADTTFVY